MELSFLKSLVIIFGVSGMVVFLLGRLKIPSIVGFLIAGVILGPHGFEFISDVKNVELLAEIGIILLMFTIGLEFSLKNLLMLRSAVFGGGMLQVSLSIGIITVLSYLFLNKGANTALFKGFLISLSSTAIVMKLLLDRAEINTPYGRMSMGVLIFQDLCVIPFMLFVPILAGKGACNCYNRCSGNKKGSADCKKGESASLYYCKDTLCGRGGGFKRPRSK